MANHTLIVLTNARPASGDGKQNLIIRSFSGDGGRSWSKPEIIADLQGANLCEPWILPSPDRSRWACLMRANNRKMNSMVIFSDDHGRSWSAPLPLPLPLPFSPINPYDYASFNDPIFRASDAVSVFAFQRGDVAESAHSIEFAITPKILASPNRMDALATEYSALFPLAKVGTRYTGLAAPEQADRPQPSLSLEPAFFSRAYGAGVEAVATANEALRPQLYSRLLALLRKKEILSADNRSRADASLLESDNKQLLLNIPQGTMQVSTPRLEGAVIKQNKPVTINRLHISECTVPAAVTMISLKESQTLENADRLLLIFATNAVNFGMVTNREGTRLLETGQAPLLIHTGKLSLSLKNRQAKVPTACALHLNGSRAESIPVRQDSDGLHVELDTARLQYGTVFFEIEYRQK